MGMFKVEFSAKLRLGEAGDGFLTTQALQESGRKLTSGKKQEFAYSFEMISLAAIAELAAALLSAIIKRLYHLEVQATTKTL